MEDEDEDKEAVYHKVYDIEDWVKSNLIMSDEEHLKFTELCDEVITELNRRF